MTKAGAFLVCAMFTAACGVGDDDDIVPPDPNPLKAKCSSAFKTQGTFEQTLPKVDTKGTADTADDTPIEGCFPVGTWTFTATLDNEAEVPDINGDGVGDRCGENGTEAPQLMASYSFRVDRMFDAEGAIDTYFAKCGNDYMDVNSNQAGCSAALGGYIVARLKVTEGGAGECTGNFEIFDSEQKKHWNFHPSQTSSDAAPASTPIGGLGEYTHFENPQPIGSD